MIKLLRKLLGLREPTIVRLKNSKSIIIHWTQQVYYDADGNPYVVGVGVTAYQLAVQLDPRTLLKNGEASDGRLYAEKVTWSHLSGPAVKFPSVPTSAGVA